MPLVVFLQAAAGPNFGPYNIGDKANLSNTTISDLGGLGVVVALDPNATDQATEPTSTE